jgi:hypothetical protein
LEITIFLCGDTDVGKPDRSKSKNQISSITESKYLYSYSNALDQEDVGWLTSKLNTELVIVDIKSTRDNCSSNSGIQGGETPLLVIIDDAQARRASKIRATGVHVTCAHRSSRCERKERKGKGNYSRRHYDEEIYQVNTKEILGEAEWIMNGGGRLSWDLYSMKWQCYETSIMVGPLKANNDGRFKMAFAAGSGVWNQRGALPVALISI